MPKSATVFPQFRLYQRLGEVLCDAALISPAQVDVTLRDQQQHLEMRFGEILVLRGWLKQETADFFAEQWREALQEKPKAAIGRYLKRAGLLSAEQVDSILEEQGRTGYKFGALAVLRGWIDQQTLDFFLESLYPQHTSTAPFMQRSRPPVSKPQLKSTSKQQPAPLFIHVPADSQQHTPPDQNTKPAKRDTTIPWLD